MLLLKINDSISATVSDSGQVFWWLVLSISLGYSSRGFTSVWKADSPRSPHSYIYQASHFCKRPAEQCAAAFAPPWCSSQPFPKGYPYVELDNYWLSFWSLFFLDDDFLSWWRELKMQHFPSSRGQFGLACISWPDSHVARSNRCSLLHLTSLVPLPSTWTDPCPVLPACIEMS